MDPFSMSPIVNPPRSILDSYDPVSADLAKNAAAEALSPFAEVMLTPEDGRYREKLGSLSAYVCEAELARKRLSVEVEWFRKLVNDILPPELFEGKEDLVRWIVGEMETIANAMPLSMANRIKVIEGNTRHDVIAMITALRERIEQSFFWAAPIENPEDVKTLLSYVHLGLTSEDVTSPSHSLMLLNALRNVLEPKMRTLLDVIRAKADDFSNVPDPDLQDGHLSLGVSYHEYAYRLEELMPAVFSPDYLTMKFAGATGTHAALDAIARDGTDALEIAETFANAIAPDVHYIPVTAQINPHDDLSLWCGKVAQFCDTVVSICADIWEQSGRDVIVDRKLVKMISVKPDEHQSGSSAMPQKVQVIHMENAKGTAQSLAAIARGLQESINVNRLQRELSDSRQIRELFGDVLPKLLQIIQNMTVDIPKLIVNEQCRTKKPLIKSMNDAHLYDDPPVRKTFSTDLRCALEVAAVEFADVPFLARTQNQPASPTTFGKELRVFAERLAYLEGVSQGSYRGKNIDAEFTFDEIKETAMGVVMQLFDDLRIYSRQRNGLLIIEHDDIDFSDPSKLREAAENLLCMPMDENELSDAFDIPPAVVMQELHAHYECLGEAVQTILRRYGVHSAYEIVKKVTRGAQMNREQYQTMIRDILQSSDVQGKIPGDIAEWLLNLTPKQFTGKALELAIMDTGGAA